MPAQQQDLLQLTASMFDVMKALSSRINDLEEMEFIDWDRFFKWQFIMDKFIAGCGIPDTIRSCVVDQFILPGLENELTSNEVAEGIHEFIRNHRESCGPA
ncbi:hypothetical protein [Paenibacillus daejeonensis]|uniref:hypothetical protein n=1 Tax=Paenibacillus daejeonensis TaxID=135193 RepID=UPI0003820D4F|nr:hypothetical protein [Paenibacillus daejeonensis]